MPASFRLLSRTCFTAALLFSVAALAEDAPGNNTDSPADNAQEPTGKEIYKKIDKNGKVIYSSTDSGGKKVELKQTNTITLPHDPEVDENKGEPVQKKPPVVYTLLSIDSPKDGYRLVNPEMPCSVTVTATLSPDLDSERNHQIQFYLNGAPYGDPGDSTTTTLSNLFRGAYSVRVAVLDKDGNELISSASVSFSIFQTSVQSPNSPLNPNSPNSPLNPGNPNYQKPAP